VHFCHEKPSYLAQIALGYASCNLCQLLVLVMPNCTRSHAINYTNSPVTSDTRHQHQSTTGLHWQYNCTLRSQLVNKESLGTRT